MHRTDLDSLARRRVVALPYPRIAVETGLAVLLAGAVVVAGTLLMAGDASKAVRLAPLVAFGVVSVFVARGLALHYPHERLGACNVVTLLRGAMAALMLVPALQPGALSNPAYAWAVVGLAGAALALDGIDGTLARREGLVSRFGARFDVEIDALLAALLALIALGAGKAGPWILALGFMRYAFVGAGLVLPWLNAPLPERLRRKTVCVVQIGALIVLAAPIVVPPVSTWIAAVATALLTWSFAVDVRALWAARR